MSKYGPIVLVDDDADDIHFISELIGSLDISNEIVAFENGDAAFSYLKTTSKQPFLIICDIKMPQLDGLELRQSIMDDEELRKKAIPFIFFATAATQEVVNSAYELTVQGFFRKGYDVEDLRTCLRVMVEYWSRCVHPRSLND